MSKPPEYPLTFAEAAEIAKNGGYLEFRPRGHDHRGIYSYRWGGWFFWWNNGGWRPSGFMDNYTPDINENAGLFRRVAAPKYLDYIPSPTPSPDWELKDYEIGKD